MHIGSTISHYRIVEKLGEGGMGVVYKAEDTKLDRPVALKFLPAHLLDNPDLRKRFEREAKSAAALDHPNVCTVHEIDDADGKIFISMALIAGESLDRKIASGPLKLNEALGIAEQVAKGLAAAHGRGIVHRDIKPENVMVGDDGHVTIMDFGLAQLTEASRLTKTNETVGTIGYMSPEQTDGSGTDHRTDIWSLGVVLYEMVTGRQPFRGDYDQAVMYSILNDDPEPITALRTGVPMEVERLVNKCVAKNPRQRYQHATDLAVDLASARSAAEVAPRSRVAVGSARSAASSGPKPKTVVWTLAALVLAAIGGAALARLGEPTNAPADLQLEDQYELRRVTSDNGLAFMPALSPDGRLLAYASDRASGDLDIWVQQVQGGGPPIRLTTDPADDMEPSFSPDGSRIVFRSMREGSGIFAVSALGGDVQKLAPFGHDPKFSPDGRRIVYWVRTNTQGGELRLLDLETGQSQGICDRCMGYAPIWSPDGKRILFAGSVCNPDGPSVSDWFLVEMPDGEPNALQVRPKLSAVGAMSADMALSVEQERLPKPTSWIGDRVLFSSSRYDRASIWQIRIDPDEGVAEEPHRLTFGSSTDRQPVEAQDGSIAIWGGSIDIDIWSLPIEAELARATGPPVRLTRDSVNDLQPDVSADGTVVSYLAASGESKEIYSISLDDGSKRRLTTTGLDESEPIVSSDGALVAFSEIAAERIDVWVTPTGVSSPRKIAEGTGRAFSFTPDSRKLLLREPGRQLLLLPVDGGTPDILATTPHPSTRNCYQHRISPDGGWVAWNCLQRGVSGMVSVLYVAPLPADGSLMNADDAFTVTGDHWDDKPRWSPDGSLLYFVSDRDGSTGIWAIRLEGETKKPQGEPFQVFQPMSAAVSMGHLEYGPMGFGVAKDKLVFNQAEFRGNIWLLTPRSPSP